MTDLSIMERQLEVLSRIEERLVQIEARLGSPGQGVKKGGKLLEEGVASSSLKEEVSRPKASTVGTGNEEPASEASDTISVEEGEPTEEEREAASRVYLDAKFEDYSNRFRSWPKEESEPGTDPKELWTTYLGRMWTLPPDGRINFSFQRHVLERLNPHPQKIRLDILGAWILAMGQRNILIQDFDSHGHSILYHVPKEYGSVEQDINGTVEEEIQMRRLFSHHELSHCSDLFLFHPVDDKRSPINDVILYRTGARVTAPWRRLVVIKGLTSSGYSKSTNYGNDISFKEKHHLWGHTRLLPEAPIFQYPTSYPASFTKFDDVYQSFLDCHVSCSQPNAEVSAWVENQTLAAMSFHITLYMIVPDRDDQDLERLKHESWDHGYLYDKETNLVEASYSTYIVYGKNVDGNWSHRSPCGSTVNSHHPWTIVHLRPRYWSARASSMSPYFDSDDWGEFRPSNAAHSFLQMVHFSILRAVDSWIELVDYFDKMLNKSKSFMNPAAHDNLLVDDEAFSRSRKYFWALSCLAEFQSHINDNIAQWETSRTIWEREFNDGDKWVEALEQMKETDVWVDKLRFYSKQFKDHHERVSALRDGLFNASSVMESRDSNKLGENVKLLTSVSIFFLPLAFCTSLWSMNNDLFSMATLIYVIILVASATYFVVFNLNSIVRLSRLAYTKQRSKLLFEMTKESSAFWQGKGVDFEKFSFKPKGKLDQPSEWLVSLYFVKKLPGNVWKGLKKAWPQAGRITDPEAGK